MVRKTKHFFGIGKKGGFDLSDYVIENIPRIIFISLALFAFALVVGSITRIRIDTSNIEMNALFQRIYFSPNAINYADANGRAHPGIIDLDKLTNENLDNAIDFYNNKYAMAAKIELFQPGTLWADNLNHPDQPSPVEIKSAILNKPAFDFTWPKRNMMGGGGIHWMKKTLPVVYEEAGEFKPAMMTVTITLQK